MIYIGNQTACWAASAIEPFEYALANGFDAFEWFPDKKPGAGWDESDLEGAQRHSIRKTAKERGIRLSVHARWQVNPLQPDSAPMLWKDLELARDLGAALLNIHLYHEAGVQAYIQAITPLLQLTAKAHLQLSIENTPEHAPEQFNELFTRLGELKDTPTAHVGMCLDLGHANLSEATRNDYLRFLDRLAPNVPLIHLHLHENWGDADTHLPLFTGPAGRDDSGIRGFLERLSKRRFSGSIILEQWPHPPSLLNNARDRLIELLKEHNTKVQRDAASGETGPQPDHDSKPQRTKTAFEKHTPWDAQEVAVPASPPPSEISVGAQPLGCRDVATEQITRQRPEHHPVGRFGSLKSAPPAPSSNRKGATAAGSVSPNAKSSNKPFEHIPPDSSRAGASEPQGGFANALLAADKHSRSWREKLDSLRALLSHQKAPLTTEQLVDTAIYLGFLGSGQVPCVEDGRHFRPGHHARIALEIYKSLAVPSSPEMAWLIRRILPALPSTAESFRRAEPLTRIRDIAHRNDIPSELKREIKHSLQNKLHRCAGPEDLITSEEFLKRFTAPGANYPPAFVEEFKLFHEELKEFFNASSLEERLKILQTKAPSDQARLISAFLAQKAAEGFSDQLAALDDLSRLRSSLLEDVQSNPGPQTQESLLADIALEEFTFALLSKILNALEASFADASKLDWSATLKLFSLTIHNLALSNVTPGEASAVLAELEAWSKSFNPAERNQLLRLKATTERARRLAETFSERILTLFPQRVEALGRALGVPEHAVQIFAEAEVRSHLVFQLSKLVSFLLRRLREELSLPAWDVLVSGQASGRLQAVDSLEQLDHETPETTIVLLKKAQGDEEIPKGVSAIVLAHELPHLSHLGVRARQAKVVLVASEEAQAFSKLSKCNGQNIALYATSENVEWKPAPTANIVKSSSHSNPVRIPDVRLKPEHPWLPLDQVAPDNAGGKADGVRHLHELSKRSGSGFQVPDALAIPFGVMEASLAGAPELQARYHQLITGFDAVSPDRVSETAQSLRELIHRLSVPEEIVSAVAKTFNNDVRLVIRSSANCEDLEQLAGAGLYDSIVNVAPKDFASAVSTVWSSLWSRRAALSRKHAGIPHEQAHMAILIQQMLTPDYSFILHTVEPIRQDPNEVYAELAVGLGETLASVAERGTPYRLICNKQSGAVTTLAFANFSQGLFPAASGIERRTIDYSAVGLSNDANFREALGRRLGEVGRFVENAFGSPQDIEGALVGKEIYLVQSRPQQGLTYAR